MPCKPCDPSCQHAQVPVATLCSRAVFNCLAIKLIVMAHSLLHAFDLRPPSASKLVPARAMEDVRQVPLWLFVLQSFLTLVPREA